MGNVGMRVGCTSSAYARPTTFGAGMYNILGLVKTPQRPALVARYPSSEAGFTWCLEATVGLSNPSHFLPT